MGNLASPHCTTTLTLGMTVVYREREYVLAGFSEVEDSEGRSLRMECLEPLYAMQNKMDKEARRAHTQEVLRLLPKMEGALDEAIKGEEWKG